MTDSEKALRGARMHFVRSLVLAASAGFAPAQTFTITRTDGPALEGVVTGLLGSGREANLEVQIADQRHTVPLARVLGLHGAASRPAAGAVAYLVGGDEVRGSIAGGDALGDSFTIRSPSLGEVELAVDRLAVLVLPAAGAGARPEQFRVPADAAAEEAVFRRAERGFDTVVGAIHRFGAQGLAFQWAEQSEPATLPWTDLAAVALAGGVARREQPGARLLTRSGDVVGVVLRGVRDGRLELELESGAVVALAASEVAALALLGPDRTFLSDVEPIQVEERGAAEGGDLPLYPWQRDRACDGAFLAGGGRAHVKGVGVHASSRLTFRVPEGCTRFLTTVAIDDGVLATRVRGSVQIRVKVDADVALGPQALRSGQAPLELDLVVRPGALLTLEADFGDGWFLGDRVDWLGAVWLRQ